MTISGWSAPRHPLPRRPAPHSLPLFRLLLLARTQWLTLWVYHQFQWLRHLPWNERWERTTGPSPHPLVMRLVEARWFYPLTLEDCQGRFGDVLDVSVMEVLTLVLALHGPDTGDVRRLQRVHRAELRQRRRGDHFCLP